MADVKHVTPKATLTISNLGPGFKREQITAAGTSTFKVTRDNLTASLALTDKTLREPKTGRDVVASADYKYDKNVTLNGKYELGTQKYQAGLTWDGLVQDKATTMKLWYSNKDNLISGEATIALDRAAKANVTFNRNQLHTAKLTYVNGKNTLEPSYSFLKQAPAVAVTRKLSAKDNLKLTYDIKSEAAAAEWNRKPFKVTLSSVVSRKLNVGKPTLSAVFEKVYEL